MLIRDAFSAKAVAAYHKNVSSNQQPYLGKAYFPADKKMGLDLKWIKTSKGLAVSLAPTTFDTKATIRSRSGFSIDNTEMAFFREQMQVSERDEQEILRVKDSNDPYAADVIKRIYDDVQTLVAGADVVPERMIWQLLAPETGSPSISISANGATYAYNYDPDGTFKANNFVKLLGLSMWSQTETADPLGDVRGAQDAIEALTGVKPELLIVSKKTMGYLVQCAKIKSAILAQNATANIFMTENRVKQLFLEELQVTIIVYSKMYKDESGNAHTFYPDDMATLMPARPLGKTWYGTTPEERRLLADPTDDVAIVNTGVTIAVDVTKNPVNTNTTVSEIVLPSFEGMDEVYVLDVASTYDFTFTLTPAAGTAAGAKITIDPAAAGTGNAYYYKIGATTPIYGTQLDATWTAYTSGDDIATAEVGNVVTIAHADTANKLVNGVASCTIAAVYS